MTTPSRPRRTRRPLPNPKRERFIQRYLETLNATQSAIDAGYSPKTSKQHGSWLLTVPDVRDRIAAAQAKTLQKSEITRERILRELYAIATSDPRDYEDERGKTKRLKDLTAAQAAAISSWRVSRTGKRTVRFWPKNAALDTLCKHLGLLIPEPTAPASTGPVFLMPPGTKIAIE